MAKSQETFNKKEVRTKKEKKRKDKEKKRLDRKDNEKSGLDDMIAYVDEFGMISSTPPDPTKKQKINSENIEVSVPKKESLGQIDPVRKGIVSFYNDSKGFGFIKDSETQESVFVHVSNLLEEIREDNLVSFEVEKGPKGPTAVQVRIVR